MRMFRSIAAVAALVMVATMTSLVASPADAAARPKHNLSNVVAGNTPQRNVFYVKGTIKTLKNKRVVLKKSTNGPRGNYRVFKVKKTNRLGSFRFVFSGRVGQCFKVFAPGTARNKANAKFVGCIRRR